MFKSGFVKRKYGLVRQTEDSRDFVCSILSPDTILPPKIDQRPECPSIYDQGKLGSCTGNAIAAQIEYLLKKQGDKAPFTPSRLFIYWLERWLEGSVLQDAGAMIRTGMKVINKYGVCPESMWKYNDGPVAFRCPPWPSCFNAALLHQALKYEAVPQDLHTMKGVLASGKQIVLGIDVFSGLESRECSRTGNVLMPTPVDKYLGGHAIVIVGYDETADPDEYWIWRNSWGSLWGIGGYGTLPKDYLFRYSSDAWTLELMEATV